MCVKRYCEISLEAVYTSSNQVLFVFQVWRIEDNELAPVERKWLGHFYGGDCYLILYKYEVNNKLYYILYMWQVCVYVTPYLSQCNVHYIIFEIQWSVIFVQAIHRLYLYWIVSGSPCKHGRTHSICISSSHSGPEV